VRDSDDATVARAADYEDEGARPDFPDRDSIRLELDQDATHALPLAAVLAVYLRIFIPM
jgi:hypothetical protein